MLKTKSLGLCVSSPIPLSLISLYMPEVWWLHWLIPTPLTPPSFPTSGTLTLLPRRPAHPGAQLRVQLCPLAQDSEMTPEPGLSTMACLQYS